MSSSSPLYSAPLSRPHLRQVGRSFPRPAIYAAPRDANGSIIFAEPPPPPTIEGQRRYRKERLAVSFRLFARYGYDMGGAGHITARDPEYPDHFWVNPAGVYFGHIRVSDLILVSHDGKVVEGDGLLNRAAFAIHSELHKARPDVIAAAHSHGLYGKAFAAQAQLLSEAAGPTKPIPHEVARHTASQIGTDAGGWFSFQPLWDVITREEPDLFD